MSYKNDYPTGKKIKRYPSSYGIFPATVTGYRTEKNLNTGQITPLVILNVHGITDDGEQVDFEESFDPSFGPF